MRVVLDYLSEVERVTHRLAILRQGRLVVVDSLENLREVAVQRLEIEFGSPVDVNDFRALPGVTEPPRAPPARRRTGSWGSCSSRSSGSPPCLIAAVIASAASSLEYTSR